MRYLIALEIPILVALALPAGAAGIVRCAGADGRVTYQEIPCAEASAESRLAIPSEYPAPNTAERDRLMAREAALDRRLEAERDRWQQDAALRAAREERELERSRLAVLEAQSQQQYNVAWPYWRPPVRPHPRPHHTGTRSGYSGRPVIR